MDASVFQDVFDALSSNKRKLVIPIANGSPVNKIIWSSFDYMVGPEAKFVWEAKYEEIFLLDATQLDDSSSDRITSTSSSKETQEGLNGLQYDESMHLSVITEPSTSTAESEPPTAHEQQDDRRTARTDESTLSATSVGNATLCAENVRHLFVNRFAHQPRRRGKRRKKAEKWAGDGQTPALITSIITSDSGLGGLTGTISVHSDLSARSSKPPNAQAASERIDETCSTDSENSEYGCCAETDESDQRTTEEKDDLLECLDEQATASFLNASSNVVSLLAAPMENLEDSTDDKEVETFAALVDGEQAAEENGGIMSDEDFVEQIASVQFDSNPMITKLSVIPSRRLMVASFLFACKNDFKTMMAVSLVLNENAEDWYVAPGGDAMLAVCSDESDTICRLTEDFLNLFTLLGHLGQHSLLHTTCLWKMDLNSTYFGEDPSPADFQFLVKGITGCLVAQGHCVVIGNDGAIVEKVMLTLSLFLAPSHKLLCLKPHRAPFSPYVRLQGLRRAAASHWPICFIDVDRKTVTSSGRFFAHRARKEALHLFELGQIFKEAGVELSAEDQQYTRRPPLINPAPVEADAYVERMFRLFFLLSDRTERLSFIDHFLTTLEYRANALIQTTKEASEPSKSSKQFAMLNLEADSLFGITLAQTQLISPSFPEFLFQSSKLTR
ncbi:hypothetical protein M3Y99_00203400 [Aphelenchoides fujianensis]|nr:hypothetical protein M3Y99_00203400 [Aphelenchoides fujianensis]